MTDTQFIFWTVNQGIQERIQSAMEKSGIDMQSYNQAQDQKLTVDQLIEITLEYNRTDYISSNTQFQSFCNHKAVEGRTDVLRRIAYC